jgi:selenide,water dikinase
VQARIAMDAVPLLPQVQQLAKTATSRAPRAATGGYGAQVALADSLSAIDKAI